MANPHRGRGGFANVRGSGTPSPRRDTDNHRENGDEDPQTHSDNTPNYRGRGGLRGPSQRGGAGRGGNPNTLGGRGGFTGGRGVIPPPRGGGGSRGRGRGQGALWTAP